MPYKIIAADASPSVQKSLQLAFQEPEFRLYPFADGRELLEAAGGLHPDALLICISLPGRDGYAVARALRRLPETRRTPLFLLKGTFETLDPERTAGIVHDAVVVKPFDSERLVADIREVIERRTTPTSLPEDPLWEAGDEGGDPEPAAMISGIRELVRAEVGELERELEKRIRAWVLADLGDLAAGKGKPAGE